MPLLIEDRLKILDGLVLGSGEHSGPDDGFCVMEAAAYVAGEQWTDHPQCVCPVIASFLRSWNDSLRSDEERTRLLTPLITEIVGTRSTAETELARVMLCIDWACREWLPTWLDLVPSLAEHATVLRSCKPIQSWEDFDAIVSPMRRASESAAAAWDAAWDAARAAAWAAAWDAARAAARDAARDAAWAAARDAARAAAWAAAWDAARAAARDAAWAAARAAAGAAADKQLEPTVAAIQQSAVDLVRRMIAVL